MPKTAKRMLDVVRQLAHHVGLWGRSRMDGRMDQHGKPASKRMLSVRGQHAHQATIRGRSTTARERVVMQRGAKQCTPALPKNACGRAAAKVSVPQPQQAGSHTCCSLRGVGVEASACTEMYSGSCTDMHVKGDG